MDETYHDGMRRLQDRFDTRRLADRLDERLGRSAFTAEDRAFVASMMGRVVEPGKFANWIAPPVMGINRQPVDFEYVRFA